MSDWYKINFVFKISILTYYFYVISYRINESYPRQCLVGCITSFTSHVFNSSLLDHWIIIGRNLTILHVENHLLQRLKTHSNPILIYDLHGSLQKGKWKHIFLPTRILNPILQVPEELRRRKIEWSFSNPRRSAKDSQSI